MSKSFPCADIEIVQDGERLATLHDWFIGHSPVRYGQHLQRRVAEIYAGADRNEPEVLLETLGRRLEPRTTADFSADYRFTIAFTADGELPTVECAVPLRISAQWKPGDEKRWRKVSLDRKLRRF